jgi:hypothetical protein
MKKAFLHHQEKPHKDKKKKKHHVVNTVTDDKKGDTLISNEGPLYQPLQPG